MEIQFNNACGCSVPGTTGDSAGLGFAEENAKYCMSLLDQSQNRGRRLKEISLQASNQDQGTGHHVGKGMDASPSVSWETLNKSFVSLNLSFFLRKIRVVCVK